MGVETVRRYGLSVRLDPSRVQAGGFARAAGARRFAFNQAVAAVRANHSLWVGQAAAAVPKADRVRLLSAQDLERLWRQQRSGWAAQGRAGCHHLTRPRPPGPGGGRRRPGVTASAVASTAGCEPAGLLAGGRRRRNAEKAVAHAQREASRRYRRVRPRSEQSANWRRSQGRVAGLHARVARQGTNDLHGFSRALVDANPILVVEALTTRNLLANHHLAGAIADPGWGELGRQLAYKATWAGGQLLEAPRFFPSSKTCACCGRVKPKLDLAVRTYCQRSSTAGMSPTATSTLLLSSPPGASTPSGNARV